LLLLLLGAVACLLLKKNVFVVFGQEKIYRIAGTINKKKDLQDE